MFSFRRFEVGHFACVIWSFDEQFVMWNQRGVADASEFSPVVKHCRILRAIDKAHYPTQISKVRQGDRTMGLIDLIGQTMSFRAIVLPVNSSIQLGGHSTMSNTTGAQVLHVYVPLQM